MTINRIRILLLTYLLLLLFSSMASGDMDFPVNDDRRKMHELDPDEFYIPLVNENGYTISVLRREPQLWELSITEKSEDRLAEKRLKLMADCLLHGPDRYERNQGYRMPLPEGTMILETRVDGIKGGYFILLPQWYLDELTAEKAQHLADTFLFLSRNVSELRHHVLMIRDPESGRYKTLDSFLPKLPPMPRKKDEVDVLASGSKNTGQPPTAGQGQPTGYLTGKSVFVNPGHGWYYNDDVLFRWATQRGNTNYIIEDMSNAEAVDTYFIQYLWNAGAGVYTCRERDMNTNMVIVDNGSSGYSESGSWSTVSDSRAYSGSYRRAGASGSETATATFLPTIPEAGYYHVYIWYPGNASNANDVSVTVNHTGGSTLVQQNMEIDGSTFKHIGVYYFNAGANSANGSVVVSNQSGSVGDYVIGDAVRFGGGIGDSTPFGEPAPSGYPRFEEAGPYYAPFMGCSTAGSSRVTAMPRFVDWENEGWEDSVYISWHSNAPDPGSGTSSFAYASGGWDSTFNGITGGLELRDSVHNELINDIRAGYMPGWINRGTHTNWYGEINPNYNDEMPGAVYEMAFHDTAGDAIHLKNPVFRQIVARAVYQGIVKYYADRDGDPTYTLLPEPPTNLIIHNNGSGDLHIEWDEPLYDTGDGLLGHAATGYKVYRSTNGFGFDNGRIVSGGNTTSFTDTTGVEGTTYYYYVTATNAGGESFGTETLGARVAAGSPSILVVSGFDRMDYNMVVVTDDPYSSNDLHRSFVNMMNSYRYITRYAGALEAYGEFFDSCSNEAVIQGQVNLSSYDIVIWFCGEESTVDESFNDTEQSLVQTFLDNGGNIFVSGSEIGWDLEAQGNGVSFYNNYLKTDYAGDDAGTYTVVPSASGIFNGNSSFSFDDNTNGEYDANYPDQVAVSGGSTVCLEYSGGSGGNAAVQFENGVFKVVNFGFPFETITSESARNEVMADILDFFGSVTSSPCDYATVINSFPYTDTDDTTGKAANFNWYSCSPSTNEAGGEVIYQVILDEPGDLTVTVSDGIGVDIDPHLLTACNASTCLARNDVSFTVSVTPGRYYIVCDTWTSSGGTQYSGAYTLNVTFSPQHGDTISPASITNLMWDPNNTRWTWSAVTTDRLGSAETVNLYDVYRSGSPSDPGTEIGSTGSTFYPDAAVPPSGCWYYRVRGVDSAGNLGHPDLDVIVDNPDATFNGSWLTGSVTPGHWGDDYRYHATSGSGSNKGIYSVTIFERGSYTIQTYYPEGGNRSTQSGFTISHAGGTTTQLVNQQTNGGTWNTLGSHWFEPGTYTVTLDDNAPAGYYILADAIRWIK